MDHAKMLACMAEMGGGAIVPVLAELAELKMTTDDRRYLCGPIVVHGAGWQDTIPKWMFDQARAERVEIVLGDAPWIVGPTEIAAVMYGATLSYPLRGDLADLYLWAATAVSARHYGKPAAEIWQQLALLGSYPLLILVMGLLTVAGVALDTLLWPWASWVLIGVSIGTLVGAVALAIHRGHRSDKIGQALCQQASDRSGCSMQSQRPRSQGKRHDVQE